MTTNLIVHLKQMCVHGDSLEITKIAQQGGCPPFRVGAGVSAAGVDVSRVTLMCHVIGATPRGYCSPAQETERPYSRKIMTGASEEKDT